MRQQFIERKQKRDDLKKVLDQTRKQNAPMEKKKNEACAKVKLHVEDNRRLVRLNSVVLPRYFDQILFCLLYNLLKSSFRLFVV